MIKKILILFYLLISSPLVFAEVSIINYIGVQETINNLGDEGETIYLPSGYYTLSNIEIDNNIKITGDGPSTVIIIKENQDRAFRNAWGDYFLER